MFYPWGWFVWSLENRGWPSFTSSSLLVLVPTIYITSALKYSSSKHKFPHRGWEIFLPIIFIRHPLGEITTYIIGNRGENEYFSLKIFLFSNYWFQTSEIPYNNIVDSKIRIPGRNCLYFNQNLPKYFLFSFGTKKKCSNRLLHSIIIIR